MKLLTVITVLLALQAASEATATVTITTDRGGIELDGGVIEGGRTSDGGDMVNYE